MIALLIFVTGPPTPRSKSIAALMKNPPFFLFFAFVMSVEIVDEVQDLDSNEKMETFNQEDQSFGIISKLMVFKVKRAEPRMSHASFVIMCSLVAVHLEPFFFKGNDLDQCHKDGS